MSITFESIWDATTALKTYGETEATLPAALKDKIATVCAHISPVNALVEGVETLYANRASLTSQGHLIAAGLAAIAAEHSFHDMRADDRGTRIMYAHMRESGEERLLGEWPGPEQDPEARAAFQVVEEPAA